MTQFIYPQGPAEIPTGFSRTSKKYRTHAWLAVLGLAVFVLFYLSLATWFGWSAFHILSQAVAGTRGLLSGYLLGGCSAFLTIFMAKALFFVKAGGSSDDLEITQESEPALFGFLYQLADDAGAPRPHRVFLSNRVNACVFYDLSILNFFFRSKKNLEIGMPLVNMLTLGELKAVLAHEFGHFAQKSMSVGRWVYIAQQIAGHIVAKRDLLDKALNFISRTDFRIAWIGWAMRLIVWSIRSLMDSLFSLVVIAQRALSREMEFQADLVAVSLTGSDALIHALHKLHAADDAWSRALEFINSEISAGRSVENAFTIQLKVLDKVRTILDDQEYGCIPKLPTETAQMNRIFKDQMIQPPQMWATHPENRAREENAKKVYVAAPFCDESSWTLFADSQQLQKKLTSDMLAHVADKLAEPDAKLASLDSYYGARFLSPAYKGAFLGRTLTRHAEQFESLFNSQEQKPPEQLLNNLYSDDFKATLTQLRDQQQLLQSLEALAEGFAKASGGVVQYNGKEYKRKQFKEVVELQRQVVKKSSIAVQNHDCLCRTAHLQAAKVLGEGWENYLKGLMAVLHYAEHTMADVADMRGLFYNVLNIALADGKVSSSELKKVIATGVSLNHTLDAVFSHSSDVQLDKSLLKKLDVEQWSELLGEFSLPLPTKQNIGQWLEAVDSWIAATMSPLSRLRTAALEQLLTTEAYIADKFNKGNCIPMTFGVSSLPSTYQVLLTGQERELQKRLGLWDRFQTADGILGTALRTVIAGGIIGSVLWYSYLAVGFPF